MRSRSASDLLVASTNDEAETLPAPQVAHRGMPAAEILPGSQTTSNDEGARGVSEGVSSAVPFALLDTHADAGHLAANSLPSDTAEANQGFWQHQRHRNVASGYQCGPGYRPPYRPTDRQRFHDSGRYVRPGGIGPDAKRNNQPGQSDADAFRGARYGDVVGPCCSMVSLDTGVVTSTLAASTAGLAFLENAVTGSPITNSGVGSGGATAAQVRAALDESGLSVNGSGIKVGVLSDSFNNLGGAAADEAKWCPTIDGFQALKRSCFGRHRRRPGDAANHPRHRARREPRLLHRFQ